MKWLKKVAATPLTNIAKVIDSLQSGTNDRLNAPSIRAVNEALDAKQNTLNFDTTPTAASVNPVRSGGLNTYLNGTYYNMIYPVGTSFMTTNENYDPNGHLLGTWENIDHIIGSDQTHWVWTRTA